MNEQITIPTEVQELLHEINSVTVNLVEIQIPEHPLLPSFKRFITINKIVIDTDLPRTYLFYKQVLKDKITNEIEPSQLPTPEWMIGEKEWSSLRDDNFNRILVPIIDSETQEPILDTEGNPKTSIVKVNTHQYMHWLLKNDKVSFLALLKSYLQEFIETNKNELDRLS